MHLSAATAMDSEFVPGAKIAGKYTLVRPLGVGGMGAVWVACNEATGAEVALKFLLAEADTPETISRFRREAYATARLSHRGIVRIYDLMELDGGRLAIVMELLHGRTLATHLDEHRKVSLDEALAIVLPLLSALSHAHSAQIIHRDLKPENVFLAVDPDGIVTPKILDFGISKLRLPKAPVITLDGEMLGTPSYMSPEQVRGRPVDARSDLFGIGIVLYEMLAGKNPFAGDGLHSVIVAILEREATRIPDIPALVWRVIERALRKPPHERFSSALELASALRAAAGLPARPSYPPEVSGEVRLSWGPPSRSAPRRERPHRGWALVASAAAAAAIASVASAAIALWTAEAPRAGTPHAGLAIETPLVAEANDGMEAAAAPHASPASTAEPPVPTAPKAAPSRVRARRSIVVHDPGF